MRRVPAEVISRSFYVKFRYEEGKRNLRVIDRETQLEEIDPDIRKSILEAANSSLDRYIAAQKLERACGLLGFRIVGYAEPYLVYEFYFPVIEDCAKEQHPDGTLKLRM